MRPNKSAFVLFLRVGTTDFYAFLLKKWLNLLLSVDLLTTHFSSDWHRLQYSTRWMHFGQHSRHTEVRYQPLLKSHVKTGTLYAAAATLATAQSFSPSVQPEACSSRELLSREDGSPNVPLILPWRPTRYWPISCDYVTYCPINRTHIS